MKHSLELALDKQKLADIRGRLQGSHLTASPFDPARYARRLETAYEAMYQRHQAGLPADHIEVQARDEDGRRGRLLIRPANSRRVGPCRVSMVDSTIRTPQVRSGACPRMRGPAPELLIANGTCKKNLMYSMCCESALITSACYLCNIRRKTRCIGLF